MSAAAEKRLPAQTGDQALQGKGWRPCCVNDESMRAAQPSPDTQGREEGNHLPLSCEPAGEVSPNLGPRRHLQCHGVPLTLVRSASSLTAPQHQDTFLCAQIKSPVLLLCLFLCLLRGLSSVCPLIIEGLLHVHSPGNTKKTITQESIV